MGSAGVGKTSPFLLTRPMRGATYITITVTRKDIEISTHTPHAGRDEELFDSFTVIDISTHTPHAGRDYCRGLAPADHFEFLLTRLLRGATQDFRNELLRQPFLLTRLLRGATYTPFLFLV